MHTILGAGGAIGTQLAVALAHAGQQVRLVGRNPRLVAGATEVVSADVSDLDQTIRAVAGSTVVHLVVGLKYDHRIWGELWPRIMQNAIEACKRAHARLIFFDNVYMYGKVDGRMTEETPFNPWSRKGEIRARIATSLLGNQARKTDRADCPFRRFLRARCKNKRCQYPGLRQTGKGGQSFLAGERRCASFVHLHAGCSAQPRAAGKQRFGLESTGMCPRRRIRPPAGNSSKWRRKNSALRPDIGFSVVRCSDSPISSIPISANRGRCFIRAIRHIFSIRPNSRRHSISSPLLTSREYAARPSIDKLNARRAFFTAVFCAPAGIGWKRIEPGDCRRALAVRISCLCGIQRLGGIARIAARKLISCQLRELVQR